MSDEPEIVVNEFGDLSRRARRELMERGVDPEAAKDEFIKTGSIQLPTQVELQQSQEASLPPFQEPPAPGSSGDSSTLGTLSKRDVQSILERASAVETAMVSSSPATDPVASMPAAGLPANPAASATTAPPMNPAPSATTAPPVNPAASVNSAPAVNPTPPVPSAPPVAEPEQQNRQAERPVYAEPDIFDAPATIAEAAAAERLATGGIPADMSLTVPTTTGSIPTTSHALILPTLPDTTGPIAALTQTGEILATGSITLPSSIAQVGADVESLDTSEVDVIPGDEGILVTQDLAPVSAAVAVNAYSTKTSVVSAPRGMSDRLPVVLSITAAGLAIVVVGLFVAGYFLKLF